MVGRSAIVGMHRGSMGALSPAHCEPESIPASPLAVIAFGAPRPDALLTIPLRQLGSRTLVEVWPSDHPVRRGEAGPVRYATNGKLLVGAIEMQGIAGSVEESTYRAFTAVIDFIRAQGYPHLLRMWNHVPWINEEISGLERYRAFSIGRYRAFSDRGYHLREDLPAASAVGARTDGLWIYFLAGPEAGRQIENRRQVSAYEYPSRYGPRSPSFSRATLKGGPDVAQLFLSGTASIIGHESVHHGDVEEQNAETWRNIDEVVRSAVTTSGAGEARVVSLKVYLRNPADLALVDGVIRQKTGPAVVPLYLEADICRADLLIEIEGVFEIR